MCSGVCSEEAEFCDPDNLKCIGHGDDYSWLSKYTEKSLDTKLGKDHGYCLKINNDQTFDSITREDEQKILGTNEPTVNYTGLVKCHDTEGDDGILCSGECRSIIYWCVGTGDVCH